MAQLSFGTILREARESKRLDLTSVARRLRIRPDILEAIEEADFTRMPPRGYTRNMVNAYAHFLGLNPTDVTRMYLDECYAYQVGNVRAEDKRGHGFDMSRPNARHPASETGRLRDSATGRRRYSDNYPTEETSRLQRLYSEESTHRSKRGALPDNHYTNFYAGPKAPNSLTHSKLPFFIAAGVILVLVIVVCVLIFVPKGGDSADSPVVPVSGLDNPAQSTTENQDNPTPPAPEPVAVAPTKFTFSYDVPNGLSSYIEVYVDGVVQEAATVAGPAKKNFDVTGDIKFVTTNVNNVKAFQDGTPITLEANENGVCTVVVKFADVLAKWQQEHPVAAPAAAPTAPTPAS